MPTNKNAQFRYYVLDMLFRGGKKRSLDQLLERLNEKLRDRGEPPVSRRTLRADIAYLRRTFDAPIEVERGRGLYYYADGEFSIFRVALSEDGWVAVARALDIMEPFKDLPPAGVMTNILQQSQKYYEPGPGLVFPYLVIDHNPRLKGRGWMKKLYRAMENNARVWINYDSFDGAYDFDAEVKPYFLVEHDNRWFLIGKVEGEEEPFWTIPLDRIHSVKILNTAFDPDEKTRVRRMLDQVIGVTYIKENPLETIEFYIRKPGADYVRTKPMHPSQKILAEDEKGIRIRIRVRRNYELLQAILKYVPNIRVIEPVDLHWQLTAMLDEGLKFMRTDREI